MRVRKKEPRKYSERGRDSGCVCVPVSTDAQSVNFGSHPRGRAPPSHSHGKITHVRGHVRASVRPSSVRSLVPLYDGEGFVGLEKISEKTSGERGGGGEKIARAITLPLCFVSTGKHYAIQRVNEFPFLFVFVRFLCSVQGDFLLSLFFNEKLS